jgi:ketosteroid isomerase-like protein
MLYIDFEFSEVNSELVKLVCCSVFDGLEVHEFWLHNNAKKQEELKQFFLKNRNQKIVSFAAVAEGRAFLSLGLDPFDFTWIDLFFEYRCLTNHNDRLLYGEQLVNGKVKKVRKLPPKWKRTEEDSMGAFRPTHSLAEATFKLLGEIRDTEHKDKMRDLIISNPPAFTAEEAAAITAYCTEDVVHLPDLLEKMQAEYYELGIEIDQELEDEMLLRGEYAALTAKMESWGYPIDVKKTQNFSAAVSPILEECQREINDLFPNIKPFRWNKPDRRFSWNQKATKEWLEANVDVNYWMKTDKDALSLSLEAWQRSFDFKHSYPKDNFGAQMVRYLKMKQNISGFIPSDKGSFWDAVGPDGRVRPYTNPFGAQSSRSQQSSRSFLFLKTAWMRALCMPKKGKAIAGIDYGSEEFLVSALLAKMMISPETHTTAQIEAYASGDVYLAFAKAAGMVPKDATKQSHKPERELAKAAVLGMSYLMSKIGLAKKLTADTGKEVTESEAQELIDAFYEVYWELKEWQEKIQEQYIDDGFLKLPCGWYMWGPNDALGNEGNDNFRSICNVPVQGFGASILRKAVSLCVQRGLKPIITLHDALYIEYDAGDFKALDTFHECMKEAFIFYFPESEKHNAAKIKMDAFSWSPDYQADGEIVTPAGRKISVSNIYIDERAQDEYDQFSKYFEDREEDSL